MGLAVTSGRHSSNLKTLFDKIEWSLALARNVRGKEEKGHNEATNLEDMTFTKPEIGKKKKKAVKPSTRNYDPRPKKAVNNENLVSQFRALLINTVPSAIGLHILPDHGLIEATEAIDEITEQTSRNGVPLTSIHGNPFIQEQPFTLDCISPFKTHPQVLMKLCKRDRE